MHTCPCGCGGTRIPSHRFACRPGWYRLPRALRDAIWDGYKRGALSGAHRAAMAEARDWYRANPPPTA